MQSMSKKLEPKVLDAISEATDRIAGTETEVLNHPGWKAYKEAEAEGKQAYFDQRIQPKTVKRMRDALKDLD
jgi:hypothetical protein